MKSIKIILLFIFFTSNLNANTNYFEEGLILYQKKEFNEAKFKFEQDIVYNPKNENSYLYLSKIFNLKKNKDLEKKNLNTVILLNPKNEEAVFNLAKLRLEESDYNGSKELITQLLNFCTNLCADSKKLKVEIENSIKK